MEFRILDLENLSSEDILITALKENIKVAKVLSREIEKIKCVQQQFQSTTKISEEKHQKPENMGHDDLTQGLETNNYFEDEVNYYFNSLNEINLSESVDDDILLIKDSMPSKMNSQYIRLTQRIKAEFLKLINEVKIFIEEEKETLSKEELHEFKNEILLYRKKVELVTMVEQEKIKDKEPTIENKLVFLPTPTGNIYALEDIDSITPEYYEGFIELFDSIKDKTLKNVKTLSGNNNKASRISEVKNFKRRVVFDRIGPHEYVIIYAFIKKSDGDMGYKKMLENRIRMYKANRQKLIENLKNPEFIEQNKLIEEMLYSKIKREKDEEKVYKRGEIKNGS